MSADLVTIRNGKILFQRFGPLKPMKQGKNSPAPARWGAWAFPYPYFDWFFAYHRWEELLPKTLRENRKFNPKLITPDKNIWDMTPEEAKAFHKGREEWMAKHRKKFPVKKFWASGPLWSKFDVHGYYDGDWNLISLFQFEKAIKKYISSYYRDSLDGWGMDTDPLEVFLGRESF